MKKKPYNQPQLIDSLVRWVIWPMDKQQSDLVIGCRGYCHHYHEPELPEDRRPWHSGGTFPRTPFCDPILMTGMIPDTSKIKKDLEKTQGFCTPEEISDAVAEKMSKAPSKESYCGERWKVSARHGIYERDVWGALLWLNTDFRKDVLKMRKAFKNWGDGTDELIRNLGVKWNKIVDPYFWVEARSLTVERYLPGRSRNKRVRKMKLRGCTYWLREDRLARIGNRSLPRKHLGLWLLITWKAIVYEKMGYSDYVERACNRAGINPRWYEEDLDIEATQGLEPIGRYEVEDDRGLPDYKKLSADHFSAPRKRIRYIKNLIKSLSP